MDTAASPGVFVVLGPAASVMRRRLGPLAWCALEAVHQRAAPTEDGLIAELSLSDLAVELGVAKNTAHRALKALRCAALLDQTQARAAAGLFGASRYRLAVPADVLDRIPRDQTANAPSPRRGARSVAGRRVAAAPDAGGVVEQPRLFPAV